MSDQALGRLWLMRLGFALLTLLILFFQLLPLDTTPRGWAPPDMLLCFACAWSLRRPDYVPALLLAAVFLLSDLLLQRPPGLWAALALLGIENLKSRARGLRDGSFATEWLTVCVVVVVIKLVYRLALMLTLTDPPALGLSFIELVATLAVYPAVVGITHLLMGVRKSAPGDLDAARGRL